MPLFGPLHLTLLIAIAAIAAALALLCRRRPSARRATRFALAAIIAVNELVWWAWRYSREGVHAENLPLQLCDLTVWLSVAACLTLAPTIVEFAYFAGLAGAGMALATPNLLAPWPHYPAVYFYIAHGGIVIASLLPVCGGMLRFRPGAVWRSFGLLAAYATLVGAFNAATGSNYMFLCRKPAHASLLDSLGQWPWYLAGGAALALALFGLLWLPVRPAHTARPAA